MPAGNRTGYGNPGPGGFWGWWWRGRWPCWGGWGRGWRHWYYATGLPRWARFLAWWGPPASLTREEEIRMLREEAKWFKEQLEAINQRLADLEKAAGEPDR